MTFHHGEAPPTSYPFSVLAYGSTWRCDCDCKKLITTESDWEIYWNECHSGQTMPKVYFDYGYAVYILHLGYRATTMYSINADSVLAKSDDPNQINVNWTELIG